MVARLLRLKGLKLGCAERIRMSERGRLLREKVEGGSRGRGRGDRRRNEHALSERVRLQSESSLLRLEESRLLRLLNKACLLRLDEARGHAEG